MSKEKILVIDDEKNIRDQLSRCLAPKYEVFTAVNGEDCLKMFEEKEFDLTLLDMKLPGIDGMEVLSKIKEMDETAIVIMITGYGNVKTAVKTMKLGAVDYLRKPFNCDEIEAIVSRVLDRKSTEYKKENLSSYEDFLNYAKKCIVQKQFSLARKYLNKAIGLDASKPEAFNILGGLYEIKDEILEAQKKYRAALALDPTYKPAQQNLERTTDRNYNKEDIDFGGK